MKALSILLKIVGVIIIAGSTLAVWPIILAELGIIEYSYAGFIVILIGFVLGVALFYTGKNIYKKRE